MPDALVEQAFLNAWKRSSGPHGVLFHSNRDTQYASHDFRGSLATLGFVPSMSRRARCRGNSVAVSFFAPLKNKEVAGLHLSKDATHAGIANYTHGFYNPSRRHSALGNCSPANCARMLKAP